MKAEIGIEKSEFVTEVSLIGSVLKMKGAQMASRRRRTTPLSYVIMALILVGGIASPNFAAPKLSSNTAAASKVKAVVKKSGVKNGKVAVVPVSVANDLATATAISDLAGNSVSSIAATPPVGGAGSTSAVSEVVKMDAAVNISKAVDPGWLIDQFGDGRYTPDASLPKRRTWWKFDRVVLSPLANDASRPVGIGKTSLEIQGTAVGYYVGGMGTYLGVDGSRYKGIELSIFGTGPSSGSVEVQLFDDDNQNWQMDVASKNYNPIADDLYTSKITVDWDGWKTVRIPFADFDDVNPGIGDDVMNFDQSNGSGGLLQIQFIFLASKPTGRVDLGIDSLRLHK